MTMSGRMMTMSGMTREEAIKIITNLPVYRAELIYGGNSDLAKALKMACETLSAMEQIRWERDIAIYQLEELGLSLGEKVDKVKEAMEKQIPKKPSEVFEIEDGAFYRLDYMCTACNSATYGQPYKPKYCKHCGQALDWPEERG